MVGPEAIGLLSAVGVWLPVWQAENVWNDAGAGHMPRFGHLSTRLVYRYKNREALCGVRARRRERALSPLPLLFPSTFARPMVFFRSSYNLTQFDKTRIKQMTKCSSSRPVEDASPHTRPCTAPPPPSVRVGRAPRATPERRNPRTDIRTDTAAASTPGE